MNTKTINSKKDFKFDNKYIIDTITIEDICNMCNKYIRGSLSIEDIQNMSMDVRTLLIYECLCSRFDEVFEDLKKIKVNS
jgi:hypothetical protein